ncbi:hypothetical protein HXX76_007745 [Chlamydomonas incerta]|uniref:Guanylate cyclase domain-containing protein n=1 Tax=Chlamydomonas incerta TaxID=51695 RepID=A0A835VZC0_CHLIN|nr:hypothetical protein HXX76_007745 [Chlamydomonas incerta]|eukprot:KAG2434862.1 hypothetical protein HXX76_007745 [Chlamydomonas incerta]
MMLSVALAPSSTIGATATSNLAMLLPCSPPSGHSSMHVGAPAGATVLLATRNAQCVVVSSPQPHQQHQQHSVPHCLGSRSAAAAGVTTSQRAAGVRERERRNSLSLNALPMAVTIFALPSGAVLHQNASSLEFFGVRTAYEALGGEALAAVPAAHYPQPPHPMPLSNVIMGQSSAASHHVPILASGSVGTVRPPSSLPPTSSLAVSAAAAPGAAANASHRQLLPAQQQRVEVMDVLSQLFMFEPAKLEQMIEVLVKGEGEVWQGIIRVPNTLNPGELTQTSSGQVTMVVHCAGAPAGDDRCPDAVIVSSSGGNVAAEDTPAGQDEVVTESLLDEDVGHAMRAVTVGLGGRIRRGSVFAAAGGLHGGGTGLFAEGAAGALPAAVGATSSIAEAAGELTMTSWRCQAAERGLDPNTSATSAGASASSSMNMATQEAHQQPQRTDLGAGRPSSRSLRAPAASSASSPVPGASRNSQPAMAHLRQCKTPSKSGASGFGLSMIAGLISRSLGHAGWAGGGLSGGITPTVSTATAASLADPHVAQQQAQDRTHGTAALASPDAGITGTPFASMGPINPITTAISNGAAAGNLLATQQRAVCSLDATHLRGSSSRQQPLLRANAAIGCTSSLASHCELEPTASGQFTIASSAAMSSRIATTHSGAHFDGGSTLGSSFACSAGGGSTVGSGTALSAGQHQPRRGMLQHAQRPSVDAVLATSSVNGSTAAGNSALGGKTAGGGGDAGGGVDTCRAAAGTASDAAATSPSAGAAATPRACSGNAVLAARGAAATPFTTAAVHVVNMGVAHSPRIGRCMSSFDMHGMFPAVPEESSASEVAVSRKATDTSTADHSAGAVALAMPITAAAAASLQEAQAAFTASAVGFKEPIQQTTRGAAISIEASASSNKSIAAAASAAAAASTTRSPGLLGRFLSYTGRSRPAAPPIAVAAPTTMAPHGTEATGRHGDVGELLAGSSTSNTPRVMFFDSTTTATTTATTAHARRSFRMPGPEAEVDLDELIYTSAGPPPRLQPATGAAAGGTGSTCFSGDVPQQQHQQFILSPRASVDPLGSVSPAGMMRGSGGIGGSGAPAAAAAAAAASFQQYASSMSSSPSLTLGQAPAAVHSAAAVGVHPHEVLRVAPVACVGSLTLPPELSEATESGGSTPMTILSPTERGGGTSGTADLEPPALMSPPQRQGAASLGQWRRQSFTVRRSLHSFHSGLATSTLQVVLDGGGAAGAGGGGAAGGSGGGAAGGRPLSSHAGFIGRDWVAAMSQQQPQGSSAASHPDARVPPASAAAALSAAASGASAHPESPVAAIANTAAAAQSDVMAAARSRQSRPAMTDAGGGGDFCWTVQGMEGADMDGESLLALLTNGSIAGGSIPPTPAASSAHAMDPATRPTVRTAGPQLQLPPMPVPSNGRAHNPAAPAANAPSPAASCTIPPASGTAAVSAAPSSNGRSTFAALHDGDGAMMIASAHASSSSAHQAAHMQHSAASNNPSQQTAWVRAHSSRVLAFASTLRTAPQQLLATASAIAAASLSGGIGGTIPSSTAGGSRIYHSSTVSSTVSGGAQDGGLLASPRTGSAFMSTAGGTSRRSMTAASCRAFSGVHAAAPSGHAQTSHGHGPAFPTQRSDMAVTLGRRAVRYARSRSSLAIGEDKAASPAGAAAGSVPATVTGASSTAACAHIAGSHGGIVGGVRGGSPHPNVLDPWLQARAASVGGAAESAISFATPGAPAAVRSPAHGSATAALDGSAPDALLLGSASGAGAGLLGPGAQPGKVNVSRLPFYRSATPTSVEDIVIAMTTDDDDAMTAGASGYAAADSRHGSMLLRKGSSLRPIPVAAEQQVRWAAGAAAAASTDVAAAAATALAAAKRHNAAADAAAAPAAADSATVAGTLVRAAPSKRRVGRASIAGLSLGLLKLARGGDGGGDVQEHAEQVRRQLSRCSAQLGVVAAAGAPGASDPLPRRLGVGGRCGSADGAAVGSEDDAQPPAEELPFKEDLVAYHEVCATSVVDPVTGQHAVVLVQQDVTAKVLVERHVHQVAETEHRLLEQIFPRHVLQYITEEAPAAGQHEEAGAATPAAAAPSPVIGAGGGGGAPTAPPASGGSGMNGADGDTLDPPASSGGGARWRPQIRDCNRLATAHPCVTVLFADIQGFTPMCKVLPPQTVMRFLNTLFTRFDAMVDYYRVYKVETIGDCYVVAGGLMHEDQDGMAAVRGEGYVDPHQADAVVSFAKAMLRAAASVRLPTTGEPVRIRVGIHSGPVVSGVVGTRMPRFCLFGDTVNTASRMESTGVPGAVHVSEDAYQMLEASEQAVWEPTGGVEVKGKGLMRTHIWKPADFTPPPPSLPSLPAASAAAAVPLPPLASLSPVAVAPSPGIHRGRARRGSVHDAMRPTSPSAGGAVASSLLYSPVGPFGGESGQQAAAAAAAAGGAADSSRSPDAAAANAAGAAAAGGSASAGQQPLSSASVSLSGNVSEKIVKVVKDKARGMLSSLRLFQAISPAKLVGGGSPRKDAWDTQSAASGEMRRQESAHSGKLRLGAVAKASAAAATARAASVTAGASAVVRSDGGTIGLPASTPTLTSGYPMAGNGGGKPAEQGLQQIAAIGSKRGGGGVGGGAGGLRRSMSMPDAEHLLMQMSALHASLADVRSVPAAGGSNSGGVVATAGCEGSNSGYLALQGSGVQFCLTSKQLLAALGSSSTGPRDALVRGSTPDAALTPAGQCAAAPWVGAAPKPSAVSMALVSAGATSATAAVTSASVAASSLETSEPLSHQVGRNLADELVSSGLPAMRGGKLVPNRSTASDVTEHASLAGWHL